MNGFGESRRKFLKSAALTAAAMALPEMGFADVKPNKRPNVLLFISDDHGTDDAGCYGHPVIKTPGMDALARDGVRFTNSFCTTASCSPSRSVILTGLQNHANGIYGLSPGKDHFQSFANIKSLPVMLASAGYRTANAGKFHTTPEQIYHYQQYIGERKDSPEEIADQCRSLIAADDPNPFFLSFCTIEPHRPFIRDGSAPVDPKDVVVPPWLPDIEASRDDLARYYMSIEREDKGLIRLMEILKQTGKLDNTLIIYISDNGSPFPGAKTTLYEPGMRLPCVVRAPGQKKTGIVNNALISWTDITPTILDFAEATPAKAAFHGRSLRPILDQTDPPGWDEIYASHTFHEVTMYYPMRVIRTRRYKLIWNIAHQLEFPTASDLWICRTWNAVRTRKLKTYGQRTVDAYLHRPEFELYDLQTDPWEAKNLAADPAQATLLNELKTKLKTFQENTKDPWLVKWTHE
ncbi:MAG: sulfatase [Armatimonadota bacterium]|nr:sulfatase [Armatimonadota bacterium]